MPAQEMTEDKKNDLTVLRMRNILDPKRFYKGFDTPALPKFFQVCFNPISYPCIFNGKKKQE